MPDTISSLMGSSQAGAPTTPQKKLWKVSPDVYTDDEGNYYPVSAYDSGDTTPYKSVEEAQKAASGGGADQTGAPTSAMATPVAGPATSAMGQAAVQPSGDKDVEDVYKKAETAHQSGDEQGAYDILMQAMKDPKIAHDDRFRLLLRRVTNALNIT